MTDKKRVQLAGEMPRAPYPFHDENMVRHVHVTPEEQAKIVGVLQEAMRSLGPQVVAVAQEHAAKVVDEKIRETRSVLGAALATLNERMDELMDAVLNVPPPVPETQADALYDGEAEGRVYLHEWRCSECGAPILDQQEAERCPKCGCFLDPGAGGLAQ